MSVNSVQYLQVPPRIKSDRVMGGCDRLVPSRKAMHDSHAFATYSMSPPETNYQKAVAQVLCPNYSPKTFHHNPAKKCTTIAESKPQPIQSKKVEVVPFKTYCLPKFEDNYYTNNLDWGKKFLAYNAENVSYIWSLALDKAEMQSESDHYHRSIKWSLDESLIAIGTSGGILSIFDLVARKPLFNAPLFEDSENLEESCASIAAIGWRSDKECTIASYGSVIHYDARSDNFPWQLRPSRLQICSLEWSSDGRFLARGGNDNEVRVYDSRTSKQLFAYSHQAGVKALKWIPDSSLLLSGGGTADHRIKLFDIKQGKCLSKVDSGAQVCSIEHLGGNKFVSGLGYNEGENILSWKWDANFKIKKTNEVFVNNQQNIRVFNVSKNPNTLEFSSISSDGCLRFWKPIVESSPKKTLPPSFPTIR